MRKTALVLAAAAAVSACVPVADRSAGGGPAPDGRVLYAEYCAVCHGSGGRGDGPAAAGLAQRPADLTRLAAGNRGDYPAVRVMAQIYGYSAVTGRAAGAMPEFGPLFEGETVLVETAPGVLTPTPAKLVALADYIRTLQTP